ncbi:MAG: hypothetical protein QXS19_08440 [Candidatus Methanomethylicia archaeon]
MFEEETGGVSIPDTLYDITQISDEEWIELLKKSRLLVDDNVFRLNASELSYFLNENAYKTREEFIVGKILGEKYEDSDYMRMGRELERYLIEKAFADTDLTPVNRDSWQQYKSRIIASVEFNGIEFPISIGGRPDALGYLLYKDGDNLYQRDFVVEVKYMVSHTKANLGNEVPPWYMPQVLSYMMIFNADVLFYAMLQDGFIVKKLMREEFVDQALNMIEKIKDAVLSVLRRDFSYSNSKNLVKKVVKSDKHNLIRDFVNFMKENKHIIEAYNNFVKKKNEYVEKIKKNYSDGIYYFDNSSIKIYTKKQYDISLDDIQLYEPDVFERYKYIKETKYVFFEYNRESPQIYDEEL